MQTRDLISYATPPVMKARRSYLIRSEPRLAPGISRLGSRSFQEVPEHALNAALVDAHRY
jgi:hypothetical protein